MQSQVEPSYWSITENQFAWGKVNKSGEKRIWNFVWLRKKEEEERKEEDTIADWLSNKEIESNSILTFVALVFEENHWF